jgi:hypothetical protein
VPEVAAGGTRSCARKTDGNLAMMPTEGESRKEETRSPRREGLVNHPETNCQRATEPAAA